MGLTLHLKGGGRKKLHLQFVVHSAAIRSTIDFATRGFKVPGI